MCCLFLGGKQNEEIHFLKLFKNYYLFTDYFIFLFQGTPDKKITLTTQQNSIYRDTTSSDPIEVRARLVDGPNPLAGRLQIFNKGKWRSVCSNSRKYVLYFAFQT
jgi:hypothetical protein